jgi:NAD(P)-dependent dehydrogenase (short-subunit alcohol dehydrogenase family)
LQHLVDEAIRQFGRIDILVCNAASNPYYGPMAGIEDEQFRKILENNVVANHWLIGFTAPQMLDRKDGSIIIVSSIGGLRGSPVIGAYCISKAADLQLARNLAVEYGPSNVRVNCIAPGRDRTDHRRRWRRHDLTRQRAPIGDERRSLRSGAYPFGDGSEVKADIATSTGLTYSPAQGIKSCKRPFARCTDPSPTAYRRGRVASGPGFDRLTRQSAQAGFDLGGFA